MSALLKELKRYVIIQTQLCCLLTTISLPATYFLLISVRCLKTRKTGHSHRRSTCWRRATCWCAPNGERGARAATAARVVIAREPGCVSSKWVIAVVTTTIRLRFDGRSTAYQRSLRSQWRNPLVAVALTYLLCPAPRQRH